MFKLISALIFVVTSVNSLFISNSGILQRLNFKKAENFLLIAITYSGFSLSFPTISNAQSDISGIVKISSQLIDSKAPINENSALYATIRQDIGLWNSAVRNIKPPPILSKRLPLGEGYLNEKFPIQLSINFDQDITPEGASLRSEWLSGGAKKSPLTISVRLDSDGVAATRSPDDLVGQASIAPSAATEGSEWEGFEVVLSGRGAIGKLITTH